MEPKHPDMSTEFQADERTIVEADIPKSVASTVTETACEFGVPIGAAAVDEGVVVESGAIEDSGFGDLSETDVLADRTVQIPKQPRFNQFDSETIDGQTPTQADEPAPDVPSDKPDIALDIQGYGPFHDLLLQEGEAGAALVPYLHRLAVPKDDYYEQPVATQQDDGDELDKGLVDRLGDENGARDNSEAWQLKDILGHSLQELKARPELIEEGNVNWLGLGTALLDRAAALGKNPQFEVRQGFLAGAATAALMSENPDDRITFLEQTAARNLSRPMASALNHSEVRILMPAYRNTDLRGEHGRPDRSVQPLQVFCQAFKVAPEEVARYRQLVGRDLDEPVDAHAAMHEVTVGTLAADEVIQDDYGKGLEDSSVAPEYVDKYRIDPTKAERFALEEMFVRDQMDAIFPGGDTTPIKVQLDERQRQLDPGILAREEGDVDARLTRLFADTQAVISAMSEPVVERYTIARPSGPPEDDWTQEQMVAWRYRQIHGKAIAYDNLAKFVDPTIIGKSSNFTDDVYDIAENGAALPGMVTEAVYNVIQLANKYQSATGDTITPRELKNLAQENRRQLMKVAAINIDHFTASLMSESIGGSLDSGTKQPAALDESEIFRKADGTLGLKGPLFKTEVASSQAGARLACVALRVNVEGGLAATEVGARNDKANSIELLTKIIFNEAYYRGIFKTALAQAA